MKNKSTLKKLANYSALASSILVVNDQASAQVIYTDINPDVVLVPDYYDPQFLSIDVDNNSVNDFKVAFTFSYSSSAYESENFIKASLQCYGSNGADAFSSVNSELFFTPYSYLSYYVICSANVANPKNYGAAINNTLNFLDDPILYELNIEGACDFNGGWKNTGDKYAALEFSDGVNTYYGWLRMNFYLLYGFTHLIVKDYAYQAIPNTAITAGDNGSNVCNPPTEISWTTKPSSVKLSWESVTGAVKYKIKYRQVGSSTWLTTSANTNQKKITGLSCLSSYEFSIASLCDFGGLEISEFSPVFTVAMPDCRLGDTESEIQQMEVFPNPASHTLFASVGGLNGTLTISLYSMVGELLKVESIQADSETIEVDVKDLPSGIYILSVSDGIQNLSSKFTVE